MQEIIETGYDGGNGFFGDELGLDVQESAVIKAINEATPNSISSFKTLDSKLIDQNFGGTNGIYWNNYTINTPLTIPILRIPTAIRFARLDKEDKEPVIHLIPVSDDFSVFPRIKIPMYLFKKAPGYLSLIHI